MQLIKMQLRDKTWLIGIMFIIVSLLFFCIPFFTSVARPDDMNLFIPNFLLAAIYFFIILFGGRLKQGREGLHPFFLFLILFFISAWSLNREMSVFEDSVNWFSTLQVVLCLNYIVFAFFNSLSRIVKYFLCFILGIAMITFLYLSFYLMPLYAISIAASPLLGISLHSFVPAMFVIYTLILMNRVSLENKKYWLGFISGSGTVIVIVMVYLLQWAGVTHTINNAYRKATVADSEGLPEWVSVAQKIPSGWMTEKVIKADLVYSVPSEYSEFTFFRLPSRNFGEERKHDPLVMIAAFFAGKSNLSFEQRISILESMFDSRHQAQDRLWAGKNLYTEEVKTTAQIWPQFSVAYTEKLVTVTNAALRSRNNQEEGIYTFHMPEGSVVTALSLWIEGKEEKGILTTKEKADEAYKTIVGYESRDPSVVHWQEGNTVSVRVFPVMSGGSRKFKIGITSPIRNHKGKLIYENIYFDGPDPSSAKEEVEIKFEHSPKNFILPAVFTTESSNSFKRSGKYNPNWSIEFGIENISTGSFSFNGKIYSVRPYQKQRSPINITNVYLDINSSWTKDEFGYVLELLKNKNVFVYDNGLIEVSTMNRDQLFEKISKAHFSLFPFFKIPEVTNSLVITKSTTISPNADDLNDSRFMNSLQKYLSANGKIRLFNLGPELSPYLKTLKEYRVFQYEHGDMQALKGLLSQNHFAQDTENDNQVIIDNAELAIVQSDGAIRSEAPDHLMRLFAYNHILQKMGTKLFTADSLNTDLIDEAQEAYIVSPISSLIVLETQKDYDRFKIDDSATSLKNASSNSKGAVPEPHEWALIIIAVMVLLYIRFQPVVRVK